MAVYICQIVCLLFFFFFFQAEDGIRDLTVTGVQTCALPILTLILALTDQVGESRLGLGERRCEEYVSHLRDEYERTYYTGVVCERRGKKAATGRMSRAAAYEWFRDAMEWYEKAEKIRPPGNDDALLRWNTCARILKHNQDLQPEKEERVEYLE